MSTNTGGPLINIDAILFKLLPLLFPLIIVLGIIWFVQQFWMYLLSIGIIVTVCILVCKNIQSKVNNPGPQIALTVILSAALIVGVFVVVPKIDVSSRPKTPVSSAQTSPAQAIKYMVVNSDALNVRTGPSVASEAIGYINRDGRVQVIDDSGEWYKIKIGDIEGYVNSTYLAPAK